MGIVIPHELVHLVFDTAVEQPVPLPAALVQRGPRRLPLRGLHAGGPRPGRGRRATARAAAAAPRSTGQFPTEPDKTYLAYAESVSAIDHLVRTDGEDALVSLVAAYADGLTDDEAFTKALGRDLAAFQAGWLKELGAEEPQQLRPRGRPGRAPSRPAGRAGGRRRPGSTPGRGHGGPVVTGSPGRGVTGEGSDTRDRARRDLPRGDRGHRRAARRAAAHGPAVSAIAARVRAIPSWQVTLGLALLGLGFLIAAQLASEGPRVRYTSQERTPLVETALDLQAQQDGLKQQILELRADIQELEATGQGGAAVTQDLNRQLEQARIAAGLVAMTGPGLVIQLSDSTVPVPPDGNDRDYLVSGQDVLAVVEELWLAGAEGIAVNGERVTVATAIVDIGGSVLVNSAYIAAPYQVSAIGPPDMFDRLTRSPGFVDFIRARSETFGVGVGVRGPGRRSTCRPTRAPSTSATAGWTRSTPIRRGDLVPGTEAP